MSHSNTLAVTHLLLKSLSVKHSLVGLTEKLEDHPEYPSLLSISDCLTEWQVANAAYAADKTAYKEIDCPFVAHLAYSGNTFILVHAVDDQKIVYSDEKKQRASMSTEEFLQKWSGSLLLAEADVESQEPEHIKNRWEDLYQMAKMPLLIVTLLVGTVLTIDISVLTWGYSLLLLVNLLGIGVTTLLLANSIDTNNPLVQNLCSLGSKNGCNAVLRSDAAKLTSWLSWSEIGFFYFSGSLLAMLIVPAGLPLLALLNLLALPYSVYSIYYQYRHKDWCIMCCMVQGLLLLGSVDILGFSLLDLATIGPIFSFFLLSKISFSFFLPIIIWYALKPFFVISAQFKSLKKQLKKFKYNSILFNQVLTNQPRYSVDNELMPIVLGNPAAQTIITMVSNPFCGPCAKAHQTIEEWLRYRDDLQLKIIYATANHDDDERTKVARHMSALSTLNNSKLIESALSDWYSQSAKTYESWAKKYPVALNGDTNMATEKQKQWCDMAEIAFTPTILVNGYKLPEPYILEDIKYLLV